MRHILITGASSGIGAALAINYAGPSTRLSLHGRSAERLSAVAAEAERRGSQVATLIGDVTDAPTIAAWIAQCDAQRPLDLVIANAGISRGSGDGAADIASTRALFATNWDGLLNTIHPAIDLMVNRRQGQVALVASIAGFHGFAGSAGYCASKAAIKVYGEGLRAELAPLGVKINVICPGFVKTPMTDKNPFSMPFIMDTDRAVDIIRTGLAHNRARIAFPLPMVALVTLLSLLPQDLVNWATASRPRKPAFDAAN